MTKKSDPVYDVEATPIIEGAEKPPFGGKVEFETYFSDKVEEGAELVRYTCPACGDDIVQDADARLTVNLDAVPVCSATCQAKSNHEVEVKRELERLQLAYCEMDRIEHEHKQFYKDRAALLSRIEELAGVGYHFQDEEGVVYEIAPKKGQWVDFSPYEMHRTRRDTDVSGRGSLSLDRAEELGYEVARKRAKAKKEIAENE
jgi:predicted RNA-binding Zn-ribbon protein involved in translation (DUF1610 family)